MKRRNFLKKLPLVGALPYALDGVPFGIMSTHAPLQKLAAASCNDRVLVILQLHGGNDGLNSLIPLSNYDLYFKRRPNVAIPNGGQRGLIPLDGTLPNEAQVGLHPDMIGVKELYDRGRVSILQGVSYERNNGSHFRGRDILFMGGGADDYLNSGWIGRYLKKYIQQEFGGNTSLDMNSDGNITYPEDFPNNELLDPLAVEFGNEVSLIFHQEDNIPTSISFNSPDNFERLVNELTGFNEERQVDPRGFPPEFLNESPYGKELNWILSLEDKTDDYAQRLAEMYNLGLANDPGVVYPDKYPFLAPPGLIRRDLNRQLKIVANLISGGAKTKVYLLRIGGFDTHALQVDQNDSTMGVHAALMYHISANMLAFQEDLKARGMEDRVLTITTSEFGRRIASNGSFGTDHGAGAPIFLFGQGVLPGVQGVNPDLNRNNVSLQFDYRQVYATILKEWMCVDPALVDEEFGIFWGDYQGRGTSLPIIANSVTSTSEFISKRFFAGNAYPNPASNSTTISFFMNASSYVEVQIVNLQGQLVKKVYQGRVSAGEQQFTVDLRDLRPGSYLYEVKSGKLQSTKRLVIVR